MRSDQRCGHPDEFSLGLVRVRHEAAVDDIRRAGNFREQAGDQPARAAFGCRQQDLRRTELGEKRAGLLLQTRVEHAVPCKRRQGKSITASKAKGARVGNPGASIVVREFGMRRERERERENVKARRASNGSGNPQTGPRRSACDSSVSRIPRLSGPMTRTTRDWASFQTG